MQSGEPSSGTAPWGLLTGPWTNKLSMQKPSDEN